MDDLKTLTQTNTMVNNSILNFVSKVGSFKKENLKNELNIDNQKQASYLPKQIKLLNLKILNISGLRINKNLVN